MSTMELLYAVDLWVDDFQGVFPALERGIGLPVVPPETKLAIPGFGIWFAFAPVTQTGVSRLCVTALNEPDVPSTPEDRVVGYPFVPEIMASQAPRALRTHATEVVTRDFDEVLERLRSKGARFRLDEPDAQLSIPRIWAGFASGEEAAYQPSTDGGLRLEILPWTIMEDTDKGIKEKSQADGDAPSTSADQAPTSGAVERFESRTFLVDDHSRTLRALEENIGWSAARTWTADGVAHAELAFADPSSATIQLDQPVSADSPAGRHLAEMGPGPYTTRLACKDLAARRDALRGLGLDVLEQPATDGSGRQALWIGPEAGMGGIFELVEPA
jgi:hypothetical protein